MSNFTLQEKYDLLLKTVKQNAWLGMEKGGLKKIVANKTHAMPGDFAARYVVAAEIALGMQKILKQIGELE